jgi:hypothetical protein
MSGIPSGNPQGAGNDSRILFANRSGGQDIYSTPCTLCVIKILCPPKNHRRVGTARLFWSSISPFRAPDPCKSSNRRRVPAPSARRTRPAHHARARIRPIATSERARREAARQAARPSRSKPTPGHPPPPAAPTEPSPARRQREVRVPVEEDILARGPQLRPASPAAARRRHVRRPPRRVDAALRYRREVRRLRQVSWRPLA